MDSRTYVTCEVVGKSADELIKELTGDQCKCVLSNDAKGMMLSSAWSSGERRVVSFARTSVEGLGFTRNAQTQEIWNRIQELGGSLCEPGDGPEIRRVLDQSRYESIYLAMEPIDGKIFVLERSGNGKIFLLASPCDMQQEWHPASEWILFRLPAKYL